MAYTYTFVISLGTYDTGLTMRGQLIDTAGAAVGGAISTGWVEIGNGHYMLTTDIPDDHRGAIYVYDNADPTVIIEAGAINPEDVE